MNLYNFNFKRTFTEVAAVTSMIGATLAVSEGYSLPQTNEAILAIKVDHNKHDDSHNEIEKQWLSEYIKQSIYNLDMQRG